jgi:hypothetical protein
VKSVTQIPTFIFTGGQLSPTHPECLPDWAVPALLVPDHVDDLNHALAQTGAIQVESYGECEEGLDVWRCQDIWAAIYWLGNQPIALAIVNGTDDFLEFQKWVSPAAAQTMTSGARRLKPREESGVASPSVCWEPITKWGQVDRLVRTVTRDNDGG